MDLQTLIAMLAVVLAAAYVVRTFTRQFTSRGQKGCAGCTGSGHGGGARQEVQLIQVEPLDEKR